MGIDPETGLLDPADLETLLDERVRLVCFPHCSNVVGAINPVVEITALAHAAGAFVCVDGVSYAPHGLPEVGRMGPDIYLFSAYKTYGPHQGLMVIRRELARMLPNQGHHFNGEVLTKRFTPAGPDHAQVAACAGIADYFDALAAHHGITGDPAERMAGVHALMRAQETALLQPLLDHLKTRNAVRLLGPDDANLARRRWRSRSTAPARRRRRIWRRAASWPAGAISTRSARSRRWGSTRITACCG